MGVSAFHKSLWPEIIRRYKAGEEIKAIAEDLGIDRKTVYNVARRAGLPNRHIFDPARTKRILAAYKSGIPPGEIAKETPHFGADCGTRSLRRQIDRRPRWEYC